MIKPTDPINYIPTDQLASRYGVKPDTVRRNLCVKGHFLGMKPLRMNNGRLLWPDVRPEQIGRVV